MPASLTEIEEMDAFAVGDRSRKLEVSGKVVPRLPGPGVRSAALGWIVALSALVESRQQRRDPTEGKQT